MLLQNQISGDDIVKVDKSEILRSIVDGIFCGVITIVIYYAVLRFGYWLLEPWWLRILFDLAVIAMAIKVGVEYIYFAKGAARKASALTIFVLTLYIAARYINITEIYIFSAATIISAVWFKAVCRAEAMKIKKEDVSSSKSLSEKT